MPNPDADNLLRTEPRWVTRLAEQRPDVVLMGPYMAYLLLLPLQDMVPAAYKPWAIAARGIGSLAVAWTLRRHFPDMGQWRWGVGITAGILAAAGWVAGQYLFIKLGWGGRLFLFPGVHEPTDPREAISTFSWWSQVVLRITVATTAVPVVEELFWRAFLLRALIDWHRFEKIPLGTFTWMSFLGTSLLSMLQHPDNWGVSVLCWFFYNGLFYWTRSVRCLILTHGVTNLALYLYVVYREDWLFW